MTASERSLDPSKSPSFLLLRRLDAFRSPLERYKRLTIHLLLHNSDQTLAPSENPSIHDVGGELSLGVVDEVDSSSLLEDGDVGGEEVEGVHPRKENSREDLLDSLLLEVEVVSSDDGRVDEEESVRRWEKGRGREGKISA